MIKIIKSSWMMTLLSVVLLTACESTDDVLKKIDHTVPSVLFTPDTLEVAAGDKVTLNALVEDESGIQRIEFTYGDWRINKIIDLSSETGKASYPFSLEITVPADAKKSWEEISSFNDGSSIKINQQYHRLALSAWDKNRNLRKSYVFVRVK
jgi:hypothetical protein